MYFISKNNKKDGPYTLDEVLAMRLTDDMLVWKDGISWSKVSELPELKQVVIKTPPPLPYEIQNEKDKKKKEEIKETKKAEARFVIVGSLFYGAIVAAVISYFINEASYGNDWPDKYRIFHSSEEMNNHLLSYWPIFLGWLLIAEIIALIIAGIMITMRKPQEKESGQVRKEIRKQYATDKGLITILQHSNIEINKGDKVYVDSKIATQGKYKFSDTRYYHFINIEGGKVISFLKNSYEK